MKLNIQEVYDNLTKDLKASLEKSKNEPTLATIRVGNNGGAISFEKSIIKEANNIGIKVIDKVFEANTEKEVLMTYLEKINNDDAITGILVFTPLEIDFDEDDLLNSISINKDVDGLNIKSIQNLYLNKDYLNVPTTAYATLYYLKQITELKGKDVLIINRSNIIGRPLFYMLIDHDATVTMAHSKTVELIEKIRNYDIIISAVGRPEFFGDVDFKEEAMLIDLGVSSKNGKYYGDFDYSKLENKNISYLPALKGVGRLNANFILRNTLLNGEKDDRE